MLKINPNFFLKIKFKKLGVPYVTCRYRPFSSSKYLVLAFVSGEYHFLVSGSPIRW